MAMYPNLPTMRTCIRVNPRTGEHETQVWYNDKIKYVVPTPKSQIRPQRISCLYKPKTAFTFTIEGKHNNPNITSYKPLTEEAI